MENEPVPAKQSHSSSATNAFYAKYLGHVTIPILDWGPHYKWTYFLGDLTAAIVVVILIIPQCMAFAVLTGVVRSDTVPSTYR